MTKYNEQVRKLCLLGMTDSEISDFFVISEQTLNAWKKAHPEFLESMVAGKACADGNVAEKLYHRALGYSHPAVKIFMPPGAGEPVYADYTEHYPPDTQAASLWLRNRQPDKWRDRREHEMTGKDGKDLIPPSDAGNSDARIIALLMQAGMSEEAARAALDAADT